MSQVQQETRPILIEKLGIPSIFNRKQMATMTSLGNQIANRKINNFNIIRLLLALAVIVSHSFPVALGPGGDTRAEPLSTWTHHQESSGGAAVNLFFLISGFLVTASWLRSKSMQDYLMKRVLRIYPGFIVAMGFSAALIWAICPEFRAVVVHPVDWLLLLLKNLLFLFSSSLCYKGIFPENPYPGVANASLWTIPLEFFCYLIVSVIGLFCLFKRRFLIFLAVVVFYEVYIISLFTGFNQSEEYLICFLTGATIWLWRDKIPFSKIIAGSCLVALLVTSQFKPWFSIVFPIMGGYCILWFAYGPKLMLSSWAEKTDLSYGTYLYAFPIQQVFAMNTTLRHPWVIFGIATPVTLLVAWLSWNLVEKRFLAMKKNAHRDFDPGSGVEASESAFIPPPAQRACP
jgi:peptidoglycan/LPS O-acetylase OafA/YrhL